MSIKSPDIQPTSKHNIQVLAEAPKRNRVQKFYNEMRGRLRGTEDIHKKVSQFHSAPSTRELEKPDPGHMRAWISLDGRDPIALRIPNTLEKDTPFTLRAGDHILKITKLDKNGYNSEYEILDQRGRRWTIIGTVFTTKSPEYSQQAKKIERLRDEIKKRESLIRTLLSERDRIDKELRSPPIEKPAKKPLKKGKPEKLKNDGREARRQALRERRGVIENRLIPEYRKDIGELRDATAPLEASLRKIPEHTAFRYTPYQSHLNTPNVHLQGIEHLGSILKESYKSLASAGKTQITEKNADGTKETRTASLTDIHKKAPPELALLLNIIERMDYMVYYETIPGRTETRVVPIGGGKKGTKKVTIKFPATEQLRDQKEIEAMMSKQSGRALTTFGLNKDAAFNWQRSQIKGKSYHEGALGMAQLIPGTYKLFQDKYSVLRGPDIPDTHEQGAKDQRVSMEFQIMHLYDEYNSLPSWIRKNYDAILRDPKAKLGLYSVLAAGYNGSIVRTLSEAGLNGQGKHTIQELYPERLKERFAHNKERLTYVMKLEYLMKIYYSGKRAKK